MHLLFKVKFWARREIIFCSKNTTKSHAIFLLGKVVHNSKNIQELVQIFGSNKNGGCFGALVSEMSFQKENEYFSFMKNIHLIILEIYQRNKVDRSLG